MYEPAKGAGRSSQRERRGEQQWHRSSRDETGATAGNGSDSDALRFYEWAIRGTNMLLDLQMSALRNVWQMQTRGAVAFGAPDCSELLRSADDGMRRVFASGTEQLLDSTRRANAAIAELQRQFGRMVEHGAERVSADVREGIEEMGARTEQGLHEFAEFAQRGNEEAERMLQRGESAVRQQAGRRGNPTAGEEARAGHAAASGSRANGAVAGEGEEESTGAGHARGGRHGEAQRNARPAKRH